MKWKNRSALMVKLYICLSIFCISYSSSGAEINNQNPINRQNELIVTGRVTQPGDIALAGATVELSKARKRPQLRT
jgi:hypothetical protein